ncbi:MAG: hypothetical protein CL681_20070 [Blastopirellula sp.]|nr:hypothetical protein [Blastopirellula sp.]
MPEHELLKSQLELAVHGDLDALVAVLFLHRDRLERLVLRQIPVSLRRRLDAEDIIQEACIRAANHISGFNPEDEKHFFAWLATIAQNLLRDALRRHLGPGGSGGKLQFAQAGESSVMLFDELVGDPQASPSAQIAADEGIERVRAAIETLPEKYREVLSLVYVKNMSAVAVAEQLQLKESAVYMRVARGKEMLRDRLGSPSNFFL